MTEKNKTVLILGAGASFGYGFPVGSGLRQMILNLRDDRDASIAMSVGQQSIRQFTDAFKASQSYSIDAFLGRRQEFVAVGKAAIAYVLLQSESKADIFNEENTDHWYQYLINKLTTDIWESFDPSWLSIVTFNYDRSLIYYLATAIQHSYNKSLEEVLERLKSLEIVHVYGSLGDPFPFETKFPIPFGGIQEEDLHIYVREASDRLIIIPEGRDDSPTVEAAQQIIQAANQIGVLGFGFDPINIRRLGAPSSFLQNVDVGIQKHAVGTRRGLTRAESMKALSQLFGANTHMPMTQLEKFHDKNCIETLRETLILD